MSVYPRAFPSVETAPGRPPPFALSLSHLLLLSLLPPPAAVAPPPPPLRRFHPSFSSLFSVQAIAGRLSYPPSARRRLATAGAHPAHPREAFSRAPREENTTRRKLSQGSSDERGSLGVTATVRQHRPPPPLSPTAMDATPFSPASPASIPFGIAGARGRGGEREGQRVHAHTPVGITYYRNAATPSPRR